MSEGLDRIVDRVERLVVWVAGAGAVVVLVQMLWISYGVFVRYGLGKPDRMVTEATALLLFPVAFAGLAYALREDAYPKVTMVTEHLAPKLQKVLGVINLALMLGVGLFFSYAGISATLRAWDSGVASEILHWPRYLFWAPGALALVLFSFYAALRLFQAIRTPAVRETD
jgi:TRAP-type C4-dicarboxylate transport system permease small subunit